MDAETRILLAEALNALDDLSAWIVNDWDWDQAQYDAVLELRERIRATLGPTEGQS